MLAPRRAPLDQRSLFDFAPVRPAPARPPRPSRLPRPHPSGEAVVPPGTVDPLAETGRRLHLLRLLIWSRRRTFCRRDAERAFPAAECPHRLWVLRAVWLLRRRCPACLLPYLPADRCLGSDGIAPLVEQRFCSDVCSRFRDDLAAPTAEQIRTRCARIRSSWDLPTRLDRAVRVVEGLEAAELLALADEEG